MSSPMLGCWNVCGIVGAGRAIDSLRIIGESYIGLFFFVEIRISAEYLLDSSFLIELKFFQNEGVVHNFDQCSSGKFLIKQKYVKLQFKMHFMSPQFIYEEIIFNNSISFQLTCVYAFNEVHDKLQLQRSLKEIVVELNSPWINIEDFNAIPCSKEKKRRSSYFTQ